MRHIIFIGVIVASLWSVSGCDERGTFYVGARFYAVNNSEDDLHIYLNMEYQFSVEAGGEGSVKDLDEGDYTALARRQSDGAIVKEEDIHLEENERFRWFIGISPQGSPAARVRGQKLAEPPAEDR